MESGINSDADQGGPGQSAQAEVGSSNAPVDATAPSALPPSEVEEGKPPSIVEMGKVEVPHRVCERTRVDIVRI